MGDGVGDQILTFVSQRGVYFGGAGAFLFYLFQTFLMWNRTRALSGTQQVGSIIVLLAAAASAGFAFYTFTSNYAPKSDGSRAATAIITEYTRCVQHWKSTKAELPPGETPADLQCFASAFRSNAPQQVPDTPSRRLMQDFDLGFGLMQPETENGKPPYPDKVKSIADVLYDYFSVYSDRFLGTGFSLPGDMINTASLDYGQVGLREYLVPNVCGEAKDPVACPEREPSTWAWVLPMQLLIDNRRTVRDILMTTQPNNDRNDKTDTFAAIRRKIGVNAIDDMVIRFQKFPAEKYNGKIGRPGVRYVFFSDLQGALDLKIRDAFMRSGQRDFEKDIAKPNMRVFIWVQVPNGSHYGLQATWHRVFNLLGQIAFDETRFKTTRLR